MVNKRGAVRQKPDPIAIATQGRKTSFEWDEVNIPFQTKVNVTNIPTKLSVKPSR